MVGRSHSPAHHRPPKTHLQRASLPPSAACPVPLWHVSTDAPKSVRSQRRLPCIELAHVEPDRALSSSPPTEVTDEYQTDVLMAMAIPATARMRSAVGQGRRRLRHDTSSTRKATSQAARKPASWMRDARGPVLGVAVPPHARRGGAGRAGGPERWSEAMPREPTTTPQRMSAKT